MLDVNNVNVINTLPIWKDRINEDFDDVLWWDLDRKERKKVKYFQNKTVCA
jgi:hypothetical protein